MYNPFIKNKIKKLYKNTDRKKEFRNMDNIQTILVLFDTNDYEEADSFIEQLVRSGKKIRAYAYKDGKDKYDYSETPYIIINAKEATDLFDNKIDDIAEKMNVYHYDALFDLSVKKNPVLEFLALSANTDMKVGYKKGSPSPYDLAITSLSESKDDSGLHVRELGKQILHYLSSIKSRI